MYLTPCLTFSTGADAAAVDAHGNTPVGLMGKDERSAVSDSMEDGQAEDEYEESEYEYEDEEEDE